MSPRIRARVKARNRKRQWRGCLRCFNAQLDRTAAALALARLEWELFLLNSPRRPFFMARERGRLVPFLGRA